jgi:hypothetical protein
MAAFHPARYWNAIKNSRNVDEVYRILERFDLNSEQEHKIIKMFITCKKIEEQNKNA